MCNFHNAEANSISDLVLQKYATILVLKMGLSANLRD